MRCNRCGGDGHYLGHSPFASLSTIRPLVRLTCYWCGGRGWWSEEDAAARERKDRESFERLLAWSREGLGEAVDQVDDPTAVRVEVVDSGD